MADARGAAQSPAAAAARSLRHPLTRSLLALTFTTGLIDAVSYLGLGRVFTANMTGNVVLLAFGIAGEHGLPVVSPLVSMATFLAGAGMGGALGSRLAPRHSTQFGAALGIECVLIVIAALAAAIFDIRANALSGDMIVGLLAFAMGVRNSVVRKIGVPDLTTTVLTMTLTGLAADSRPAGGSGGGSARRIAAVVAMLTGALSGALLLKTSLALPLACAAALALVTYAAYIPARRREEAATA